MVLLGLTLVLPFLAATAALLSVKGESPHRPLRETLLIASVLWGVWLVLGTELLSLMGQLRWGPLILWWLVPAAGLGVVAARDRRWVGRLRPARERSGRPDWLSATLLAAVGVILAVTAIVAAVTPPNNWDSQTYHLPRQVRWMQQGSVAHFADLDLRQTAMPPLAEFAGVHLMILTGGDAWANLVQWFALAMTALAASLIAKELGGRARSQSLAALLVVTNPMAAMQAVNTKNDLVLALWACAMAYFVLRVWTERRCAAGRTALIGLTLGLMLLTKGTALIVGLPISLAAAVVILRVERWRGLLIGAAIGAIALAINAGHFSRNIVEFGSPTGPSAAEGGFPVANEMHSPAAFASTLVRNVTLHLGTPWDGVNASMQAGVERLHSSLGLDTNELRTTFQALPYTVQRRSVAEDVAPATLHMILALVLLPVLLALQRRNRALLSAALVTYAAFLIFCLVLKWQPWHARLHLPIVCLFAPVAATAIGNVPRAGGMLGGLVGAVAVFLVAPSILWNQQKPLLGSPSIFTATWTEGMFRIRPVLRDPFEEIIEACLLLEPRTVAIVRVDDQWTYPFQRALLDRMEQPPEFTSLAKHRAQRREYGLTAPDVIIHTDGRATSLRAHQTLYVPAAFSGQYTIFVPQATALARGLTPDLPAFVGWHNSQGLDRLEGPYPQQDLPRVRWGLGPATKLRFPSDGGPALLVLEGRRNNSPDQTLVVRLNGEEIARHEFGPELKFHELRIPLELAAGQNELVLEYGNWGLETPRPIAVLYRRLQILPGEQDGAEGAGEPGR